MVDKMNVREIFANADAEKAASAGSIRPMSGRDNRKALWPTHKRDKIDDICVEYKDKGGYAQWQKEKYPTKVEFPKWVRHTRTFTSDLCFKDIYVPNSKFRKADFDYNRNKNESFIGN